MTKNYTSEAEFLKDYDSSQFEKLSLTADILIFSVSDEEQDNYRKRSKKHFSVLMLKRDKYPYKDKWNLPGSFVGAREVIDAATKRILLSETGLHDIYMEQLYTFDAVERDPRMRIISTAYMALIDKNKLDHKANPDAVWFNIEFVEKDNQVTCILENGDTKIKIKAVKVLKEKTSGDYTYRITENKDLAFDHALIILYGISRMRNKIEYTDIVFNMMPKLFTLGELQQVYEVILGEKLLDPAFRRMIQRKVTKTDKQQTGAGHRPSALFKYKG